LFAAEGAAIVDIGGNRRGPVRNRSRLPSKSGRIEPVVRRALALGRVLVSIDTTLPESPTAC
jgi:hypothetical protein